MKKYIISVILCLATCLCVKANYWTFDPNAYSETMSVIGVVQINEEELASEDYEIGAFCGDECRGYSTLTFVGEPYNRYYLFLSVSGKTGDNITFRIYNKVTNQSAHAQTNTLSFVADNIVGSVTTPQILTFNISGDDDWWTVSPNINDYTNNITIIGKVMLNDEEVTSANYLLGAFCGNECRVYKTITYYEGINKYLVFLTILGNDDDVIKFVLKNNITGDTYTAKTTITFHGDDMYGTVENPYVINFSSDETQIIPLEKGTTWFSTYIACNGEEAFENLTEALGDKASSISSQVDGFSTFTEYGIWMGSLDAIYNEQMYAINTDEALDLQITGPAANPAEHPITIHKDWNWIGYIEPVTLSVDEALQNLEVVDGDVIKSQTEFSMYVDGLGWIGSMEYFTPGYGYKFQSTDDTDKSFTYPINVTANNTKGTRATLNHWQPDKYKYSEQMNVIAAIFIDDVEQASETIELGAFCGDECRGSQMLKYFGGTVDRYLAFITIYGNVDDEITFRLYDNNLDKEFDLFAPEAIPLKADEILGTAKAPYQIKFIGKHYVTYKNNGETIFSDTVATGASYTTRNYPAIETGYKAYGWTESEITTFQTGKPTVVLSGKVVEINESKTYNLSKKLIADTFYTTMVDTVFNANTTISTTESLGNIAINQGAMLTITGEVHCGLVGAKDNEQSITIAEGGQLEHFNVGVAGAVNKTIQAPADNELEWWGSKFGWHVISSPLTTEQTTASFVDNTIDDYDLEYWDASANDWVNIKYDSFDTNFEEEKGYLAAYQTTKDFTFKGKLRPRPMESYEYNVSSLDKNTLCLLGNPLCVAMNYSGFDFNYGIQEGITVPDKLNGTYTYLVSGNIQPATGYFIYTTEDNPTFTYDFEAKEKTTSKLLDIKVKNSSARSNMIVLFNGKDGGFRTLNNPNDEAPMIYAKDADEKAISIANVDNDIEELPLSYSAGKIGTHSMTIETEGMFEYLHLIDKFAGVDVDMLQEKVYSYTASPRDPADRFILRFVKGEGGYETVEEVFVVEDNEELKIFNLGERARITIADALGRVVYEGTASESETISTARFTKGVLIVRVVDEKGIKTQKIVLK